MEMKELSSILQQSGIVGAGGAGFPTYAKLDERAETIILNCAECEPLLRLHRQLLEKYAREIVETFYMIGRTVGAKDIVIGIKKAYKKTIEALNACIGDYEGVRLGLLDEVYPAGDEVVLIYEVTGKVVRPGGLPIESGVAVFNVETVYNVYRAVKAQTPVVDKLVSVVAEVKHPVTVRVPIGCTLEEVVSMAGGSTVRNPVYFVGGPMMGNIGIGSQPVTKTTNAILVLPEDHLIIQKKNRKASIDLKRAAASCCQCTMCTDLCPRNRLGHPIEPHKFMRAATCKDMQETEVFLNTMFCSSCGLCEMYSCMQSLSPRSLMADYKAGLRANGIRPPQGVEPKPVGPEREYRKVPMERLMARLDLTQYDKEAPLQDEKADVKRVRILLGQHIGAPASPIVKPQDMVEAGQMIAEPGKGLSVGIHASITGRITEVSDKCIVIEK
ncbi:4Fe-4S dicluster domain-containing protein [Lachnospiraceae bacterium 50-23]|jgi:Na+-translocating ferredoxin:NAD+ oxidoreductase RnfC subunit|nr:NADH-quinone oxidoreductase subunit J [Dorea sp.]